MFQKAIEAVIEQGQKNLESIQRSIASRAEEAHKEVERCKTEIEGLVKLAKDVPSGMFSRYTNVMVTRVEVDEQYGNQYPRIRINNFCESELHGVMGDEKIKSGKYRAIVLLEPIS